LSASGKAFKVGSVGFIAGLAIVLMALATFPAGAGAHAERQTFFPDPNLGDFPQYRTDGPTKVVCRKESRREIENNVESPGVRREALALLSRCRFQSIQMAVNYSTNGTRILVLPGEYKEVRWLGPAPAGCEDVYARTASGATVLSYEEQRQCPHAQNLIAIMGDTNGDRICDSKCNIQIEGKGDDPGDVRIEGQRTMLNVIRADRADGVYLKNFTVENSDFNNVYFLETNGFRIDTVVSRYSREYGILSFTSDHGIYEDCEASYNGDSGVYPGSGPNARHGQPDAHGHVYGIEIRRCNSHHNTIGESGTAGNGTWAHDNRFHDNATGITTDSFASGHPGMPQDNSKWSHNLIYSNNNNLFTDDRDAYCQNTPFAQRDPQTVCPTFQVPVGTGLLIAGGNSNVVQENYIWDNWRRGTMLHWVPAALRGEQDSGKTYDTSANNRYDSNCMGVKPVDPTIVDFSVCDGTRDANGVDFWWDEEEGQDCVEEQPGCVDNDTQNGNCWTNNSGDGGQFTSDPPAIALPTCPGLDLFRPGNSEKQGTLVPCATWDPTTNTDPPGCDWFTTPPEPQ
jgi:hypothetical protein